MKHCLSLIIISIFSLTQIFADSASEFEKVIPIEIDDNDKFGEAIAIDGSTMIVGAPYEESGGSSIGAAYIYKFSGNSWVEDAKLVHSDAGNGDNFGFSVAISGNLVIVGATGEDLNGGSNNGAAYIFANTSGNNWVEQTKIFASDTVSYETFGNAVSISGNLAVIGARSSEISGIVRAGAAYVFANTSGNTWIEQTKVSGGVPTINRYLGHSVTIDGNVMVVGSYGDATYFSGGGAAYIYANTSANIWAEQAVITQSDQTSNDEFGNAVSLSGNLLLVGARGDDVEGAAYIFANTSGNTWVEQAKLEPSDGEQGDVFGYSVVLSGNLAVIGAYQNSELGTDAGAVYYFTSSANVWTEQEKFVAGDGMIDDSFGYSVGLSGNLVVVGVPLEDSNGMDAGAVYAFDTNNLDYAPVISPSTLLDVTFSSGQTSLNLTSSNISVSDLNGDVLTWTIASPPVHGNITVFNFAGNDIDNLTYQSSFAEPVGDRFLLEVTDGKFSRQISISVGVERLETEDILPAEATSNYNFGRRIDTDGQYMIVGTPSDSTNGSGSGAASIYARSGNTWEFQYKLMASDSEASDSFGDSVGISGNLAIVGAQNEDEFGNNSGAAYIFANTSGNTWVEQMKITSDQPAANYQFGKSVAIGGNIAIVGSTNDSFLGTSRGSAFVFTNTSGNTWELQSRLIPTDHANYDNIGVDVDISGNVAIVGGFKWDFGTAYVFSYTSGNTWVQQSKLIPNDNEISDRFGQTVAISENIILVGSPLEDTNGTESGSAYIFTNDNGGPWTQQAKLTASDGEVGDNFGESIALSGSQAVIGTYRKNGSTGAAYLFTNVGGNVWVEDTRLTSSSAGTGDSYGAAVGIGGNVVLVGEIYDDTLAPNSGIIKTFELGSVSPYISENLNFDFEIEENGTLSLSSTDISALSYYGTDLAWTVSINGMNGDVTDLTTSGNNITTLSYMPNLNYSGFDSFTLRVTDLSAGSFLEKEFFVFINAAPILLQEMNRIGAGYRTIFALTNTDYFLGGANDFGQIGQGFSSSNLQPMTPIGLGTSANQMAYGAEHGLVVDDNGQVWTWGNNNYGQLGLGDNVLRYTPTQVAGLSDVARVYAGAYSSYALTKYGDLYSWGRNQDGQLGIDSTVDQNIPQHVVLNGEIQDFSAGISHSLAIVNGNLMAWGSDGYDQLGDGIDTQSIVLRDEPITIDTTNVWERVFAGGFHSHGITSTNSIYAWGKNERGQLGVGHDSPVYSSNTTVVSLANIQYISSGYEHSLFLDDNGEVWATGSNLHGQVANGFDGLMTPQKVTGLTISSNNELSAGPYRSYYLQLSPLEIHVWGRHPSGNIVSPINYYTE